MTLRIACLLALGLFLALAPGPQPALARSGGAERDEAGNRPATVASAEYTAQCVRHGLRCTLVYAESASQPPSGAEALLPRPRAPVVNGPLAVLVVIAGLAAIVFLWMRFGSGGILLSSAPRDMKGRRGETPESWRSSTAEADERPDRFLERIAAMGDRRQALIELLRRCLLHAAEVSGTRLFRSDTERAVLGRLPEDMPGRDRLEMLLREAELVHYGGRALAENRFAALLSAARSLLDSGRSADA